MRLLGLISLFAALAFGQTANRVFSFANTTTPLGFEAIADAIRTIGDIQQVSLDGQAKTLTVTGTTNQIAFADWLFHDLDIDPQGSRPSAQEYPVPGGADDVVRVFYLSPNLAPKDSQEIVNSLRTVTDIRRVFLNVEITAVSVRGASAQTALAAWMVSLLAQPAGTSGQSGKREYVIPGAGDGLRDPGSVVCVYYLTHTNAARDIQQVVNAIRSVTDLSKIYQRSAPAAVTMRGHPEQIALAEWLVDKLDRPASEQPATAEYVASGTWMFPPDSGAVRVFYMAQATTEQALQAASFTLRTTAHIMKMFPCTEPRAVALRGNAVDVAQAESLMAELNQPGR